MSSLVLPCLGLAVDAHALSAPKGAMRAAEHVVCDLPGIVRGRPNFEVGTNKSTAFTPRAMRIFDGARIVVSKDATTWRIESETGTITGNADPVDYDERETSFAEARKSLYYCSSTGVRALRSSGGSATEAAGLDLHTSLDPQFQCFRLSNNAIYGPFTPPCAVAYAMVVKRTDANGYEKRSAPTQRWELRASAGVANQAMKLFADADGFRCMFASGTLVAGDVVEVYRTLTGAAATTALAADLYLALSYIVTSQDITSGYFPSSGETLYDRLVDADLGEALYTNPQRAGALNAKFPPIMAQELALWQSCMWYGRTKDRHRLVLTFESVGLKDGGGEHYYGDANALGFLEFGGSTAVGVNTITGVASVAGVLVGDYVADAAFNPFDSTDGIALPKNTTITNITGAGPYTLTLSANALSTQGPGYAFVAGNRLTVDGLAFAMIESAGQIQQPYSAGKRGFTSKDTNTTPSAATRRETAAKTLAAAVNSCARAGLLTVRAIAAENKVTLERTTLTGASFAVSSSKPLSVSPYGKDGLTSTQEDRPNRVYFSLPDEPEAVPILNYFDVGSEAYPIQRLIPCGDALLVFKEDGLYRITGSYPRWSLDTVDPEIRLVRPEAAAVINNTVYAWTNRGVCEIDESGIRSIISAGKIDTDLFGPQGAILGDLGYHGARILLSPRHQLVLLAIPDTTVESPVYYASTVYCYALKTGAWTKWPMFIRCGDTDTDGVLWIAANNALDELEWETRYLRDESRGFDRQYSIAAWTATGGSTAMSITNAQRGDWVPTVGDWVSWKIGPDEYRRIIAVVDLGGGDYSWTLDTAAPSNIASATSRAAYEGAPVLLEWLPSAMGTAGAVNVVWRGLNFSLDQVATALSSPTAARITLGVRHDGAASIPTLVGTPPRATVQTRPYRMGWPRQAGRRVDAAPRLSWSEIYWTWRLAGVTLIGEDGSERVRR